MYTQPRREAQASLLKDPGMTRRADRKTCWHVCPGLIIWVCQPPGYPTASTMRMSSAVHVASYSRVSPDAMATSAPRVQNMPHTTRTTMPGQSSTHWWRGCNTNMPRLSVSIQPYQPVDPH
eukprot:349632-Chlamydomonas_euryale.AAC.27